MSDDAATWEHALAEGFRHLGGDAVVLTDDDAL
jgi:hypothetical protein